MFEFEYQWCESIQGWSPHPEVNHQEWSIYVLLAQDWSFLASFVLCLGSSRTAQILHLRSHVEPQICQRSWWRRRRSMGLVEPLRAGQAASSAISLQVWGGHSLVHGAHRRDCRSGGSVDHCHRQEGRSHGISVPNVVSFGDHGQRGEFYQRAHLIRSCRPTRATMWRSSTLPTGSRSW